MKNISNIEREFIHREYGKFWNKARPHLEALESLVQASTEIKNSKNAYRHFPGSGAEFRSNLERLIDRVIINDWKEQYDEESKSPFEELCILKLIHQQLGPVAQKKSIWSRLKENLTNWYILNRRV